MKNCNFIIQKEINCALENLRGVPLYYIENLYNTIKINIETIKNEGIIIVSLSEYKKLVFEKTVLGEAIKRGYGLPLPKKIEKTPGRNMPTGERSSGSSETRKRRRLYLVCCR